MDPKMKLAIGALTVLAAASSADTTTESRGPEDVAGLADVMQAMVEPSAQTIWNSVSYTSDENGSQQNSPQNDAEWQHVRNAGVVLGESMSLVASADRKAGHKLEKTPAPVDAGTLPPEEIQRLIDGDPAAFAKHARLTQQKALQVIAAVDARDPKALEAAGAELDQACEGCHVQFWYPTE